MCFAQKSDCIVYYQRTAGFYKWRGSFPSKSCSRAAVYGKNLTRGAVILGSCSIQKRKKKQYFDKLSNDTALEKSNCCAA